MRVTAIIAALAIVAGLAYWGVKLAQIRWARGTMAPQIARLVQMRRYASADELVRRIEWIVPNEQQVREFRRDYRMMSSVQTTPAGAEIAIKDYSTPDAPWRVVGKGPMKNFMFPIGYLRWRVSAAGFQTREFAETVVLQPSIRFTLIPEKDSLPGMAYVPAGPTFASRPVQVPAFWMDQFEITNRKYQEFVKAGGYRHREFWQEPFVRDGQPLTWEQAMDLFRDQTRMAGPANWQLGTYPEGQAEFPVTGVSWYEAAAYARYAGKSLPTYYHFMRAARTEFLYADDLLLSNFSGKGLGAVGSYRALNRFGTYDLAGNAEEWCWNEFKPGLRLVLGGAWDEAPYSAYSNDDAAAPMERRANLGFRCVKYEESLPASFPAPVAIQPVRDYSQEKPLDGKSFAPLPAAYEYAHTPLRSTVEAMDDSSPYWRMQKVSLDTAYGHERMAAYLFLPRNASPPYQTVVYFPSGIALTEKSSSRLEMWYLDPLIRAGRAVLYPVLWDTYERHVKLTGSGVERLRALAIHQVIDVRRCLDYLETRNDIDHTKLAYFGFSFGAINAPITLAVEPRFRTAVLAVGGLTQTVYSPDSDPFQFAPHVHTPVLMLNGRFDVGFPVDTSVRPLFNLLGTATADKKMAVIESGHAMVGYLATTKESLAWLDRYLGPIQLLP